MVGLNPLLVDFLLLLCRLFYGLLKSETKGWLKPTVGGFFGSMMYVLSPQRLAETSSSVGTQNWWIFWCRSVPCKVLLLTLMLSQNNKWGSETWALGPGYSFPEPQRSYKDSHSVRLLDDHASRSSKTSKRFNKINVMIILIFNCLLPYIFSANMQEIFHFQYWFSWTSILWWEII